ncbi:DUF4167 domain-containing protein [Asticcacaulis sp. SL142]|uniref:DUF4167 domain-containing protein n=1 Tax=Asticcacaulis sp. SL142 TaxID=2995155 RepID=UPI00226D0B7E|nr:DUF4167 domain-containing protein [Asticcacaulis sp. SL142]WAC49894.1 DUF4167 domain-containing protein [Asticcacaulis sp. SL142]
MKRQRGRNRNTTKPSGQQNNNPNRAYESTGPEGAKVRGNAQTIYEKYQQLARDANSSGDRVLAENYLQHAEHYFRLIRQMQPTRAVSEFVVRDPFSNFYDVEEDGDGENENGEVQAEATETEAYEAGDASTEGDQRPRNDNRNDDRNRDRNNRDRNDRDRNDRNRDRNDRDRNRDRPYEAREPREPREPRPERGPDRAPERVAADRGPERDQFDADGNRRETRRERYERRRSQRLNEQEQIIADPLGAPPVIASTEPLVPLAPVPLAPVSEPAFTPPPASVDADHLPAFLRAPRIPREVEAVSSAPEADDAPAEAVKKPRAPRRKKAEAEPTSEEA